MLRGDIHGLHRYCDLSKVNRGHQRSMTFDDVICHFSGFCAPKVVWCADFECGIRLSFNMCRNRVNTPKKNDYFCKNDPQNVS